MLAGITVHMNPRNVKLSSVMDVMSGHRTAVENQSYLSCTDSVEQPEVEEPPVKEMEGQKASILKDRHPGQSLKRYIVFMNGKA